MAAGCLLILGGCSKNVEVSSAPPVYLGIPAGMTEPCVVRDIPLVTIGDLVESRNLFKAAFAACAAKVVAIREHDVAARAASSQ